MKHQLRKIGEDLACLVFAIIGMILAHYADLAIEGYILSLLFLGITLLLLVVSIINKTIHLRRWHNIAKAQPYHKHYDRQDL